MIFYNIESNLSNNDGTLYFHLYSKTSSQSSFKRHKEKYYERNMCVEGEHSVARFNGRKKIWMLQSEECEDNPKE